MLALLLGPPGGGKSYEATVFHVLPAIESGRKVITNLPLNIAEFVKIEPRAAALIELRTRSRQEGAPVFSVPADYGDDWRDPESGRGPLYVIDECHKAIPRRGLQRTPDQRAVDEWYAEHRHEGADVLLITQSYGKISKDVVDQIQVTYRVKKMTAFGDSSKYLRKVQDGVRGDVLSTSERVYQERFFPLYKSHTRSAAAVIESDQHRLTPAHVKWRRAAYAFLSFGVLWLVASLWGIVGGGDEAPSARTEEHAEGAQEPTGGEPLPTPSPPALGRREVLTDAAAQPPAAVRSQRYRLTGVVLLPNGRGRAFLSDGQQEFPVTLAGCRSSWPDGWACEHEGEIVNARTGPEIESEAPAAIYAAFSPQ